MNNINSLAIWRSSSGQPLWRLWSFSPKSVLVTAETVVDISREFLLVSTTSLGSDHPAQGWEIIHQHVAGDTYIL